MRTKHYLALATVLILAVLAGIAVYPHLPRATVAAPAEGPQQGAMPPMPVETAPVTVETLTSEIAAVGTLQSDESVVIQPEIAGRVARIAFGEGEKVPVGAVLVELDPSILQAELAQARANLALAESNDRRARTLAGRGTGTAQARDEAQAQLQSVRASVTLAQARLEKAVIKAPFAGTLGLRSVSVGQYVAAGERIVNLEATDPLKVDFRVPEVYLAEVREGQPIKITVDALPDETFRGEIYAKDPQVDPSGRAIRLRARIPNPGDLLTPGLFARISVIVDQRSDAILVPEAAIVPQGDGKVVYRVEDGRAVMTPVELGARRPGEVEIVEGLRPDAVVVTAGQQRLNDGAPVSVQTVAAGS